MQIAFIFTIIYPVKNTAVETTCRVVIQDVSVSRNLTSQTVAGDLAMGGVPTLGCRAGCPAERALMTVGDHGRGGLVSGGL